jgi:predicted chitinase
MALKIYGNFSPNVGKTERYTIDEPIKIFSLDPPLIQPVDHKVKWCIYVLENGKWRKTKENDKTGATVSYTFKEKSLSRKGIKIEAQRGFEKVSEIIHPQKAHKPKILRVELLDSEENKLSKPLSYGQTVIAKAHCTGMEYEHVYLTLWEDDAKGAGHNSVINKSNKAITKPVEVKRGIAKTSFKLSPSFDKMAKAFHTGGGEGELHEYYVTATMEDLQAASNNINVEALEEPARRIAKKVTVLDQTKPKPYVPKPYVPLTPEGKKGITEVKLFKTSATTLQVHVHHNGLQGKKIRLKLMEDDTLSNDLLMNHVFSLPKNTNYLYIPIDLKTISVNKGDDAFEGSEQELFVDIEVIETDAHHKTGILKVNSSGFKQDPVDNTNKTVKVVVEEKKEEEKKTGNCFCNRDISVDETKKIIKELRDSEAIKNYNLFTSQNCPLNDNDKTYEKFTTELNNVFIKYEINTCIRKIHFLAQIYLETDRFRTTVEYSTRGEYYPYIGRGLMQLTWKKNYQIYKSYSKINCVDDYNLIANNLHNSFDSAGWYWKQGKVLSVGQTWSAANSAPTYVKIHNPKYLKKTISYIDEDNKSQKYGTVDLGLIADNDTVDVISYLVNGGSNGLGERRIYAAKLKQIFKYPQNCISKKNKDQETPTDNKPVTIRLVRKWQTNKSTIGEFSIDDSEIKGYILEEKGPDTTESGKEQRIPVGTYNLVWHSGAKFSKALKLYNNNVSINRAILIHAGNTASDTEGCLLPGKTKSTDFVGQSKKLVKEILDFVEEKGIEKAKIIITQDYETN